MIMTGLVRLGADAELRYTNGGEPVVNMRLAFNYVQKDNIGSRPAQWIEASLFGKRAESLAQYLTKGTALVISIADPHIETWTKKDLTTGFKLVGKVLELEFAGGGREAGRGQSVVNPQPAADSSRRQDDHANGFNDIEDDIPF